MIRGGRGTGGGRCQGRRAVGRRPGGPSLSERGQLRLREEGGHADANQAQGARALTERAGPLRLMGVGVSGLVAERQLTLF